MHLNAVFHQLGKVLMIIGGAMLFPLLWAVYDKSYDIIPIAISLVITFISGLLLFLLKKGEKIGYREGFTLVTLAWLIAAFYGSLPFILSGTLSTADAFFETMSGFTTTGASILTDIEALPRGLLFWRSLTHWLGGIGIMVLFVALLSHLGMGAVQIFKAEYAGPFKEKLMPRIRETAKILLLTYLIISLIQFIILKILGMSYFDALAHTFSTIATGGFSTKNASIGHFESPAIQWAITFFMFVGGINFMLIYRGFAGRSLKYFWKNPEFKLYLFLVCFISFIVTINIIPAIDWDLKYSARAAAFQVVSIMTGTGFATVDYDLWPLFPKALLFFVMFLGGSASSTTGSIKIIRWLILIKHSLLELQKILHPRALFALKIADKTVDNVIILRSLQFFFIFILTYAFGFMALVMLGLDFTTAASAAIAALGNVGPGFGSVGPALNYGHLPMMAKYLLSFLMLLGRLELFTILVLLLPSFWKFKRSKL